MSEELELEVEATEEAVETPEYTEIEQEAIEKGWKPEGVEGKRNKTAEQFLDAEEYFAEIHKLRKALKTKDKELSDVSSHVRTLREDATKEALERLKQEKKVALEEDDHDRVIEIDEKMAEVRETKVDVPQGQHPDFTDWIADNSWYAEGGSLTAEANQLGEAYAAEHPGVAPKHIYKYVRDTIEELYPEKFGNVNRAKANPVEGTTRASANSTVKTKYSEKDLPPEHREIMNGMVKRGDITKAEYLKSYFNV